MRYRIVPYRQGSASARALAQALGGRVLRLTGSTFQAREGDVIINWGNVTPVNEINPSLTEPWRYLNLPGLIRLASNKLNFFQAMPGVIIPQFWTNRNEIPDDAYPIVCRTVLAGHSGDGIVIADSPDGLVDAPLYVKYVKKSQEYRIHVGLVSEKVGYPFSEGAPYPEVISVQRKARKLDVPDDQVNWKVRNLAGGFIYARDGVEPPACVVDAAKRSLMAVGLDFGAVDVIYNQQQNRAYVLEMNTAPGISGTTIDDYVKFFKGE